MPVATRLTDGELRRARGRRRRRRSWRRSAAERAAAAWWRPATARRRRPSRSTLAAPRRAAGRRSRRARTPPSPCDARSARSRAPRRTMAIVMESAPGMASEATPGRWRAVARLGGVAHGSGACSLWTRGAVLAGCRLRRALLRSCDRRPGADATRATFDDAGAHPAARRLRRRRALAAGALGRRLVPAHRRRRLRRQRLPRRLLPALPAAGARDRAGSAAARDGARLIASLRRLAGSPSWRRSRCCTGSSRSSSAAATPRPALLLLAVFPGALYFGAPYSESLFLLCSVGAFLAARKDRWALAGLAGGGRGGHAQRRPAAARPAGDPLVAGPRRAGRRRRAGCCSCRRAWSPTRSGSRSRRRRRALPRRSRTPGPAS